MNTLSAQGFMTFQNICANYIQNYAFTYFLYQWAACEELKGVGK